MLGLMDAREKNVEPHFDLDPLASPVLVDKTQIQQVLINLVRNAIDAMADCPVRRLSVSSRPGPSGFVQVVVADTGPGVTPEIADKLFTAFVSRSEEHTSELQSLMRNSYAVFCLQKKNKIELT